MSFKARQIWLCQKIGTLPTKTRLVCDGLKAILVNSKPIFFHSWYNSGVVKINDLLNNNGHSFLAFDEFLRSFNIRTHFLQYYSLISAISNQWKKQLFLNDVPSNLRHTPKTSFSTRSISCRKAYKILRKHTDPPTSQGRLIKYGIKEWGTFAVLPTIRNQFYKWYTFEPLTFYKHWNTVRNYSK